MKWNRHVFLKHGSCPGTAGDMVAFAPVPGGWTDRSDSRCGCPLLIPYFVQHLEESDGYNLRTYCPLLPLQARASMPFEKPPFSAINDVMRRLTENTVFVKRAIDYRLVG